jgi:hypothetical protein
MNFWRASIDTRKADVFAGFGNNGVLDLAMRRDSEVVIMGDIDPEVPRVQEYLYKPLALISETPGHFLSYLAGIPISEQLARSSLTEVFYHLVDRRAVFKKSGNERNCLTEDLAADAAAKIANHPALTPAHAAFVQEHLAWLTLHPRARLESAHGALSAAQGEGSKLAGDPFSHFALRYYPELLLEQGGSPSVVLHPKFSIISSPEAFAWYKERLARNQILYFSGSMLDSEVYHHIGRTIRDLGGARTLSGLSITNIPDTNGHTPDRANNIVYQALSHVLAEAPIDSSFTIYRTLGIEDAPYSYEDYGATTLPGLVKELSRHGHEVERLEHRSPFASLLADVTSKPISVGLPKDGGVCFNFGERWAVGIPPVESSASEAPSMNSLVRASTLNLVERNPAGILPMLLGTDGERRIVKAIGLLFVHFAAPKLPACAEYAKTNKLDPVGLAEVIKSEFSSLHRPEAATRRAVMEILDLLGVPWVELFRCVTLIVLARKTL